MATRKGTRLCGKCGKNRQEKFFKPKGRVCQPCQRGRTRLAARDVRLMENYGLTLEQYDLLLDAQDGRCYICGGKRPYNLDVDHCHKTGLIRGLLCKACNRRLLPAARDNVSTLERAIGYLLDPPAQAVLPGHAVPNPANTES